MGVIVICTDLLTKDGRGGIVICAKLLSGEGSYCYLYRPTD
jgi:hypothetical protein